MERQAYQLPGIFDSEKGWVADVIKGVVGRQGRGISHFMSTVSYSQNVYFYLLLTEIERLRKAKQLAEIVHKASERLKRDFAENVCLQSLETKAFPTPHPRLLS